MGTRRGTKPVSNSAAGSASARDPPWHQPTMLTRGSILPGQSRESTHVKGAVKAPTPTAPGHRTRAKILALVTGSYATSLAGSCKALFVPVVRHIPTAGMSGPPGQRSLTPGHEPVTTVTQNGTRALGVNRANPASTTTRQRGDPDRRPHRQRARCQVLARRDPDDPGCRPHHHRPRPDRRTDRHPSPYRLAIRPAIQPLGPIGSSGWRAEGAPAPPGVAAAPVPSVRTSVGSIRRQADRPPALRPDRLR